MSLRSPAPADIHSVVLSAVLKKTGPDMAMGKPANVPIQDSFTMLGVSRFEKTSPLAHTMKLSCEFLMKNLTTVVLCFIISSLIKLDISGERAKI